MLEKTQLTVANFLLYSSKYRVPFRYGIAGENPATVESFNKQVRGKRADRNNACGGKSADSY
jgi:hypothetical protein